MKNRLSSLILMVGLVLCVHTGYSQSGVYIVKMAGDPCVGSSHHFYLSGVNTCSSTTWTITGNYTINSQSNTSLSVTWNSTGSFTVTAQYSCIAPPNTPVSGTTPAVNISITSNQTSSSVVLDGPTVVDYGSQATFTATASNAGTSPNVL